MNVSLEGQVAVVTGAASGLGWAISKKLSEQNVQIALVDKNIDQLKHAIDQLKNAKAYEVNITEESIVAKTIEDIESDFGKIDILINSAGITGITNIKSHQTSTENIRLVFDINFIGSYFSSKYVLPVMLKNNYGRILHIASIAGKEGNAGMLAYSASKAAIIAMTKVQAKEYADTGITINAIAPAVIRTALVDQMPEEQVKYMTEKIPMKRCGTLDEFASLASFIVSPENSFTTGFTFDLSGGRATY